MNNKPFDIVSTDLEVSTICLRLYEKWGDDVWLSNASECAERIERNLKRAKLSTEQLERAKSLMSKGVQI